MPELDREGLSKHFELEVLNDQVDDMIKDLEVIEEENAEVSLKENIDRANRILDQVEDELTNGNFSARLVEVASQMINSVTSAASQIQSTSYNNDYLQLREKLLFLKRMDLKFRIENAKKRKDDTTKIGSQNIILTDRESVLKVLKGGSKDVRSYKGDIDDE